MADTLSDGQLYRVRRQICVHESGGDVRTFGQTMRQHRQSRELSLRRLGELTSFGFTFLSQIERGERRPTEKLARICDEKLGADGVLIDAYWDEQAGKDDMRRRSIIKALGGLAANSSLLVRWESLRRSMTAAANADFDEWDEIVADYGASFYRVQAGQLMENVRVDLTVINALMAGPDNPGRRQLLRAASRLSVIVALNMVAAGQTLAAGRWWRNAYNHAVDSSDKNSILHARAWSVVNGCYDGRDPSEVVALSDEVLPLTEGKSSAESCGLLAGRAQALSLAGRHDDAVSTVRQLAEATQRLPTRVAQDVHSLWGWPEHRLRHTEAWVYAHAGDLPEATKAQERAIQLYPPGMTRLRTQVQLHHAAAMVRHGHIPDGLRLAADVLDGLPTYDHNELLRTIIRQVANSVPAGERKRPVYRELTDHLDSRRMNQ